MHEHVNRITDLVTILIQSSPLQLLETPCSTPLICEIFGWDNRRAAGALSISLSINLGIGSYLERQRLSRSVTAALAAIDRVCQEKDELVGGKQKGSSSVDHLARFLVSILLPFFRLL
jgi:hypothetical protein